MSSLKKLMQARITLQGKPLKKSGKNKFAGYSYFELSDFLPTVQSIFNDLGLAGVVSFGAEMATLTIVDTDNKDDSIVIETPMSSASLKGCHDVQNLGAVQTYLRRYLWVTAMEIVEHDALDGGDHGELEEKNTLTLDQQTHINDLLEEAKVTDNLPFCKIYKVSKVSEIPKTSYVLAVNRLKKRIDAMKNAELVTQKTEIEDVQQ